MEGKSIRVGIYSGDVESNEVYKGRIGLVSVSLSNLYLELESISVSTSEPSSSLIFYYLLTTYTINYCPNQIINNFVLRKMFYTR